jgi:hypothetical protein
VSHQKNPELETAKHTNYTNPESFRGEMLFEQSFYSYEGNFRVFRGSPLPPVPNRFNDDLSELSPRKMQWTVQFHRKYHKYNELRKHGG